MTRGIGTGLGLALVFVTGAATAAPIDGRVRLSLEASLFSYESQKIDTTVKQTTAGIASPGMGLGIAGGLGSNFLLGGRLLIVHESTSTEGSTSSQGVTQVSIFGTPEYVFDGKAVRPFIAPSFGYTSTSVDGGGSSSAGLFGAGIGAHCFGTDSFSIDPSFFGYYEVASVSVGTASRDGNGFALLLGIAFAGWFGQGKGSAEDGNGEPTRAPDTWQPSPPPTVVSPPPVTPPAGPPTAPPSNGGAPSGEEAPPPGAPPAGPVSPPPVTAP